MLATMRPVQHYPSNSQNNSRSASRNSNHSTKNNGSPSSSPSRAASAKLDRSSSSNSNKNGKSQTTSATSFALPKKPDSSVTSFGLPKKPVSSSLSKEVEAVEQTKPGLITLSKPLDSGEKKGKGRSQGGNTNENARGRQQQTAGEEEALQSKGSRSQRKKKATPAALEDVKASGNVALLSRSAPTSDKADQSEWEMPTRGGGEKGEAPMTWQQQMINSTSMSTPEKKKTGNTTKKGAGKKGGAVAAPSSKESLTWQQELLGSNKPRGPAFDVFADARDEATFGSSGDTRNASGMIPNQQKGRKQGGGGGGAAAATSGNRKRADSVGEMRLLSHAKGAGISAGPPSAPLTSSNSGPIHLGSSPSTPNGKFAYAGPNFHNSPSPASLPVPKFLMQKGGGDVTKSPSTLFAKEAMMRQDRGTYDEDESEEEWEEDQKRRSIRGVTAPPDLQSEGNAGSGGNVDSGNRSVTIESLLAKMMRTGSD